ncbi:MAG TPA: xanthine dehydrogenase family protein subunit M [Thermoanaerobaculia bacterium]|nr:xanthine dehydrogenase family protein subunit M [Thermoanaerobaculia bacterium]
MRYLAPKSVEEAVQMLASTPDARVFAGATDLIPQFRAGRREPGTIVDLKRVPRLMALARSNGTWAVGAATPASDITVNANFRADFPGLVEAAGLIGSDQIQSRASLGGNLCNASPAADTVPPMVVNGARAVLASKKGIRTVAVAEVCTGPGSTSLRPDELLVELQLDRPPARTGDAYLRFIPRTEMDIAVVGAAARITLDSNGRCTAATIALGAVAPTVVRVPAAEQALVGSTLDKATLEAVAAAASAACNPIDDKRGTKTYRRQVAGVLAKRAVLQAAERARRRKGGRT